MPVTMTRRAALIAAAAVPLSACASDATDSGATADPDRIIRERATGDERLLIARYRATAEAYPGLEQELAAFAARHERHLEQLLATSPPASTDDSNAEQETQEVPPDGIPGSRADAVTALRDAEAAHAAARMDDSMASYDYELARVFASVAACESAHNHLLGEIA